VLLYAVIFFHCSLIEQNSFRAHFLFLPKFHSLGCYENVTTFHSGPSASAEVFSNAFLPNPEINFGHRLIQMFVSFCFHWAILPQSACAGCDEIITTFMMEKPTFQGMARPCFWKWGSSN
jgi:hypothetical protein